MKEKKDPATLKAFFSLSILLVFLLYNPRFLFAYKRGSRAPMKRGDRTTRARHEHTIERQATVHSFHQRVGILSLSRLFVTPTTNQVSVT